MNVEDSDWISRGVLKKARTEGASSSAIESQLRVLQESGAVKVTPSAASAVLCSLRDKNGHDARTRFARAYAALVELHRVGELEFSLPDVIRDLFAGWETLVVEPGMASLIEMVQSGKQPWIFSIGSSDVPRVLCRLS